MFAANFWLLTTQVAAGYNSCKYPGPEDSAMSVRVVAVGKPEVPPIAMPDRFRRDVTYFMTLSGEGGIPKLPHGEYWIRLEDARVWLDDCVVEVVSPLDSRSKAEIEITDEQEAWLEWLIDNEV